MIVQMKISSSFLKIFKFSDQIIYKFEFKFEFSAQTFFKFGKKFEFEFKFAALVSTSTYDVIHA